MRRRIVTFHGLGKPRREIPSEEEPYWLDPAFFESILDVLRAEKNVVITFDDSNESDYTVALPLLRARNMSAGFFVLAGRVNEPGFLSAQQISGLLAAGMTIGSHGMEHKMWTSLSPGELQRELADSRRLLEQICNRSVLDAACPFGGYRRRTLRGLREAGYERVFTSDGGDASAGDWIQPRNTIMAGHSLEQVAQIAVGRISGPRQLWRRIRRRLKRWR